MKKLSFFLVAAVVLSNSAGCQEKNRKDTSVIVKQAKADLELSCVAEFLRSDGSKYLTEQKYEISSNPKAITITAKEPFGQIIWSVQNGKYIIRKNVPANVFDRELYRQIMDKNIAESLLELYLAGLNKEPVGKAGEKTLKFENQLYEPVVRTDSGVSIYRNKATGKLDLVTSGSDGKVYFLHGFNYRKMEQKENAFYPSKIDIFLYHTDFDKELIAQISCF